MDTKLTLKLNKRSIVRAKAYARRHHKSLSGMVENYFNNLTSKPGAEDQEIPDVIRELKGIAKLPADYDFKADYATHLEERNR